MPNHAKWAAALAAVMSLTGCADFVAGTVAFGDSVTFGFGGERGGWVSHLEEDLGGPIANFGVPGERVVNGKVRFAGPLGPMSLAPLAKRVLLLHGGNDLAEAFLEEPCNGTCEPYEREERLLTIAEYVEDIVKTAQRHDLEVTLATYWRVNAKVCKEKGGPRLEADEAAAANRHLEMYDALLLEMAARNGLDVVRLDELDLESDPDNFYDCIHPSDEGYRILADAWRRQLRD